MGRKGAVLSSKFTTARRDADGEFETRIMSCLSLMCGRICGAGKLQQTSSFISGRETSKISCPVPYLGLGFQLRDSLIYLPILHSGPGRYWIKCRKKLEYKTQTRWVIHDYVCRNPTVWMWTQKVQMISKLMIMWFPGYLRHIDKVQQQKGPGNKLD